MRCRGRIAVTAVVGLAGVMGLAAGAAPTGDAPGTAAPVDQQALLTAADALAARGATDPSYATTSIDPAAGAVVVHRVGGGTGAAYAGAAPGVRVIFRSATLTARQQDTLQSVLWDHRVALARGGVDLLSVGGDGAGPVVAGVARVTPAARTLVAALSPYGRGSVRVEQSTITPTGRQDGAAPWRAGGRIVEGAGNEECSAGFTGLGPGGARYVLTAYHCVDPHDTRIFGPRAYVGRATTTVAGLDLAAVRTSATVPYTWDGRWNETGYTKRVARVVQPRVGMRICTSGSFSGVRCYATVGGKVTAQLTTAWGKTYTTTLWYASSVTGAEIIRSGDSGGPVFVPTGSTVTAVGLISAGYESGVACAGAPGGDRTGCYRQVLFSSVADDAARLHVDLTR